MKKIYLAASLVMVSLAGFAQCSINQGVFNGPTDYSIHPDTVTNIPVAYVGVGYTTDLQFHVQPDTVTQLGTFNITHITIDSVSGIPANFSYMPNPSNGVFPGGSYGCIGVTGNAVSGQETGGPNSDGVYPIIVYYTATVDVFSVPTDFPATKTGYKLRIVDPNAVPSVNPLKFSVGQNSPNPADNHTEFQIVSPNGGQVQLTIFDILGSKVSDRSINVAKGTSRFDLGTSDLAPGVYMCTFRMGSAIVTKRISVAR
ncbi:MAG TPA: T9SS type A sorting domain-containing protein [Bacteroidia bacterium]|nr:T9SS type A sorting domain-containing protein [Bacteroidia bacterium]